MNRKIFSTLFTIVSGLGLLAFGINDLYDEFLEPSHVHTFIFIAVLLLISAAQDVHEGLHKLLGFSKKESVVSVLSKCNAFFERKGIKLSMASIVLAAASYGVFTNIEEMYYRCMPVGMGMFMFVMPLSGGIKSTKALSSIKAGDPQ